ncbi:hypothetical protein J4444_01165 [Candidatus Woesearchaeota archaeon]|nr:hypothetical protein [Candidatus Woesearchaeota archaeon]
MVTEYITEAPRIFFSSLKHRISPKKYSGTADEICQQIVKDCWNGKYFQTSTSNFAQFWSRDFGWCTKSLLELGYKEEVHKTLRYALNRFKQSGKITTTITPMGKPFNFPCSAVDSLPWFIHSILISKFPYYDHRNFLNKEVQKFFDQFINPQTGLVNPELHVSSMKDYAIRKSSCYDNTMVALLARDLKILKLHNPFEHFNYPDILKRHFWNGRYFYDDLSKQDYVAGDANLFPFALGIINDTEMLQSAMNEIQNAGLDTPFPLKYTRSRQNVNFIWQEIFSRNYESNAIWMHMGPLYVKLLGQVDKEKTQQLISKYTEIIEHYKGFLEVFDKEGYPFKTPFYHSDRAMLWAANYLTL